MGNLLRHKQIVNKRAPANGSKGKSTITETAMVRSPAARKSRALFAAVRRAPHGTGYDQAVYNFDTEGAVHADIVDI
jgi:hypothetical protein